MTSTRPDPAPAPVTDALIQRVRSSAGALRRADAEAFLAVADWAQAYTSDALVEDPQGPYGIWDDLPAGGDTFLELGGPGCPVVAEFSIQEVAAARGVSFAAARSLVGDAVELRHRLPRLFERVAAAEVDVWRARRVAQGTRELSRDGAAYVDQHLTRSAHKLTVVQIERAVAEAATRFDPELAEVNRCDADGERYFTVDYRSLNSDANGHAIDGVAEVHGRLDLADARDLDSAVAAIAGELADLGSIEPLDARRASAVGELARRQLTLEFTALSGEGEAVAKRTGRQVVLNVHLSAEAITGGTTCDDCDCAGAGDEMAPDARIDLARLDTKGLPGGFVSADQVRDWCSAPDTKVIVKPVIDLAEHVAVDAYEIPDRIADRVRLKHATCVFPYCTRPSRACDLDHREPWTPVVEPAETAGFRQAQPPVVEPAETRGQTSTTNLFPLCRRHHRMKTHPERATGRRWTYTPVVEPVETDGFRQAQPPPAGFRQAQPPPAGFRQAQPSRPGRALIWTSPHGHRYRVDPDGTTTPLD